MINVTQVAASKIPDARPTRYSPFVDNGRLSPRPVCESTKFIEDLLSVGEEDDRRWDDIAEDYEIPAAEARNRGGKDDRMDAARLEELANLLRSGQVIRIEARRQNGCGVWP